jgi:phosphoribosylformylglycinamidine cyclo-ligase
VFEQILRGFTKACRQAGCALIGGETAQMPGMYQRGEYDLAGTIVGVVDRKKMIDGSRIGPGDAVLGLEANGLHTNGYSLARKILFETMGLTPESKIEGIKRTLGDELLKVHRNYQPLLAEAPEGTIKGLAHITGGGLVDNLPRVLPKSCDAVIDTKAWKTPAIFQIMERAGKVERAEMFQVFNMGIGMAVIVSRKDVPAFVKMTRAKEIGRIESGSGMVRMEC